jgi:hypothetical protein
VGVHNTYDPATFRYLAQALDEHPGLMAASTPARLCSGATNKNLEYCLDDIRLWLSAHPDTGPMLPYQPGAGAVGRGHRRAPRFGGVQARGTSRPASTPPGTTPTITCSS